MLACVGAPEARVGSLGVFGLEAVADTHIYAMPLPLPQPAKRNTAAIARAWLFGEFGDFGDFGVSFVATVAGRYTKAG